MKRILIIKMSSLGDLFHALPTVHALRQHTGVEIHWLVHDLYADLVKCLPDVERVITFPRRNFLASAGRFLGELRRDEYDLVIDLQGLLKSAVPGWLARSGQRLGPSFHREGSRLFYSVVVGPRNKERHAVEECADVLRYLSIHPDRMEFPVRFPAFVLEGAQPRVGMLPCSRWPSKNWPPSRFIEVGRELVREFGASIHLVGGKDDQSTCRQIAEGVGGGAQTWAGRTTLLELGGLLQQLDLLVTVDSGPMHMAAAVGTPLVAVFGPTFPVRTGPYGAKAKVIKQGENLSELPADPVLAAARGFLACK